MGSRRFQFYSEVSGNRAKRVTCGGTKSTGISAHVRGWDVGVRVIIDHCDGKDCVRVYATKGSNAPDNDSLIATIIEGERPIVRAGE